jgi:hydrogenase maturation protease
VILVAGLGNIFLADDAFGSEVARRMQGFNTPSVRIVDFGIRGLDLAYALGDGYTAVIIVDACPRGGEPGTTYVIEPALNELPDIAPAVEAHAMDPVRVLALARSMGTELRNVRIVGCEPETLSSDDGRIGLSPRVAAAVEPAISEIQSLVNAFLMKENTV